MADHTPGPWRARPSFSMDWDYAVETDDVDVAHVLRLAKHDELPLIAIGAANAALIAAAPELLEAAKLACDAIGYTRDPFGLMLQAEKAYLALRTAIAKAEAR